MNSAKRNILILSLCFASLLSLAKGEETSFMIARRGFSSSIVSKIKKVDSKDDSVFNNALNQANGKIDTFSWIKGFNSGINYYDPSTDEGKNSLEGDHFAGYEDDILDFYDGLDSEEKDYFIKLQDDGDNDVDNMISLLKYRFDLDSFSFKVSPDDIVVNPEAFKVAKENNKYDMAIPSIGKPVTTTPGHTDPGKGPIFGGGLGPIHSSSVSREESTSQNLNDMLLLAGLSVAATAVIVGGVKTIEGTIAAWFIPSFAKAAIIAVAILAIMVVIIVYFQQILDIFSAIAQSLENLVSNFVSGISQMFEDAKKKGYESLVDGSFWDGSTWTEVINLTAVLVESLLKSNDLKDYFIAFRPNAILKEINETNTTGILPHSLNILWIVPLPISDDEAVKRLKDHRKKYGRDAYTPLRSHALEIEQRVLNETDIAEDKSSLYIFDCPGDSKDKVAETYHHFHINSTNDKNGDHALKSHNFYGLPYSKNSTGSTGGSGGSGGGRGPGGLHLIVGGKNKEN